MPALPRRAFCRLARRTIDAALESGIAQAAASAFGNFPALTGFRQVADQLAGIHVVDDGAAGYEDLQVVTRAPGFVAARAGLPVFRAKFACNPEIRKCIRRGIRNQIHAAAMTAVTAVGAAPLDVLFTPKTQTPMTAIAGLYTDRGLVNELHESIPDRETKNPATTAGLSDRSPRRSHCLRPAHHAECPRNSPANSLASTTRPGSDDADELAVLRAFSFEAYLAVLDRKQRVIAADADVDTRMKMSAALPDDDVTRHNFLAAEDFDAQTLGFRIAAVFAAAACLFVCHACIP